MATAGNHGRLSASVFAPVLILILARRESIDFSRSDDVASASSSTQISILGLQGSQYQARNLLKGELPSYNPVSALV